MTVGEALARRWWLILLTTIMAAAGGVAIGLSRPPVFTSEAELNAGSLDAQAQAIPGYVEASQTLAEAYARIVQTTKIQAPVAHDMGRTPDYVASHLTAASVPSNPVFRIDGTGGSAVDARSLALAATQEIVKYAHTQTTPPNAAGALSEYMKQSVLASQLASRVGQLRVRFGPSPTAAQQAQLSRLQERAASAQLQANASQQLYIAAITNTTGAGTVIVLSPAGAATSNRKQTAEIAGFGGAVVGCVIGSGLAVALAARRRRRLLRAT